MRLALPFFLLGSLVACSSTETLVSAPPSPVPTAAEADAGVDGRPDDVALTPASLHITALTFHSASVTSNGFKDGLDFTLPETTLAKLPYQTDEMRASISSQTSSNFIFSFSHFKARGKDDLPESVGFAAEIPRKVGPFTISPPAYTAWLFSTEAPDLDYTVTCRTDHSEVLSESADRRVYQLRISGGCDWDRSGSTTKETIVTELTITLLPLSDPRCLR